MVTTLLPHQQRHTWRTTDQCRQADAASIRSRGPFAPPPHQRLSLAVPLTAMEAEDVATIVNPGERITQRWRRAVRAGWRLQLAAPPAAPLAAPPALHGGTTGGITGGWTGGVAGGAAGGATTGPLQRLNTAMSSLVSPVCIR